MHTWGQQRVLYREGENERTRSLPAAWTDVDGPTPTSSWRRAARTFGVEEYEMLRLSRSARQRPPSASPAFLQCGAGALRADRSAWPGAPAARAPAGPQALRGGGRTTAAGPASPRTPGSARARSRSRSGDCRQRGGGARNRATVRSCVVDPAQSPRQAAARLYSRRCAARKLRQPHQVDLTAPR